MLIWVCSVGMAELRWVRARLVLALGYLVGVAGSGWVWEVGVGVKLLVRYEPVIFLLLSHRDVLKDVYNLTETMRMTFNPPIRQPLCQSV